MDLITLSVLAPNDDGRQQMAVVLLPAASPGISVRPFWKSPILGGAESDEVVLDNVAVSEQVISYSGAADRLDQGQVAGFVWFEMLITAAYVGVASGLAARVFQEGRGVTSDRARVAMELCAALASLEGLAADVDAGDRSERLLAKSLLIRYSVQHAIERSTMLAAELLGGMAFIGGSEVAYLVSAARALAFHPPSRTAMSEPLCDYLGGGPLAMAAPVAPAGQRAGS
jgi:alkylation response protein AidB-like acyl-CoA dehydrogenase